MAAIGSLELSWNKGYDGRPAEFISQDAVAFKCGSSVKFISEDGTESLYSANGDGGVGAFAVHGINSVFAFAEQTLQPKIHIVQFPSMLTVTELKDGAQLEYKSLTFSTSEYIASISGIPEFQLIIWKYTDGTKLVVQDLSHDVPTCMAFNPGNWRQLSISTDKELTVWTVEQNNKRCKITKRKLLLLRSRLNKTDNGPLDVEPRSRSAAKHSVNLPMSAIAGLQGADADKFTDYKLESDKLVPISHCWTPSGDILIGCADGELVRVDAESNQATRLTVHMHFNEEKHPSVLWKDLESAADGDTNDDKIGQQPEGDGDAGQLKTDDAANVETSSNAGRFTCLALHKRALFAGGMDGKLCELQLMGTVAELVSMVPTESPITSLYFNPSHHKLAVGSSKGSIHMYHLDNNAPGGNLSLIFDYHHGDFVAVRSLASSSELCVTLRQSGQLQVWTIQTGSLVSSFPIKVKSQAGALGVSPLSNIAAVGTDTGHLHIVDLHNVAEPRLVSVVRLHQDLVRQVEFTANGEFLLTAASDGAVFVVAGRAAKRFEVLGYVAVSGLVIGMSTFFNHSDGATSVVVTCCKADSGNDTNPAATKLVHFRLPGDLANNLKSKHQSLKCNFKTEVVNDLTVGFNEPVYGITMVDERSFYAISQTTKTIQKYRVPDEAPKRVIKARMEYRRRTTAFNAVQAKIQQHAQSAPAAAAADAVGVAEQQSVEKVDDDDEVAVNVRHPAHKEIDSDELVKIIRQCQEGDDCTALQNLVSSMALSSDEPIDKELAQFLEEKGKEPGISPLESHGGHLLPGGRLQLSPHQKWLGSCGGDGRISIRLVASLDQIAATVSAHSFWRGGVLDFAFAPDGQSVLTTGHDGTVCCFKLRFMPQYQNESTQAATAAAERLKQLASEHDKEKQAASVLKTLPDDSFEIEPALSASADKDDAKRDIEKEIEAAIANDQIYTSEVQKPPKTATWLEVKHYEAITEEDKAFANVKRELREEIRQMRRKLQGMMAANATLTEIEKLSRHEFDLDVEEQKRLQEQCEVEVQKLREEKEFENLAKMYLTDIIRKECWDDMTVKGRGILAFNTPLEVYNFPLMERQRSDVELLEVVKARRRIEMAEIAARKEIVDPVLLPKADSRIMGEEDKDASSADAASSSQDLGREKSTMMGSLVSELGADNELFHSQFELCTREQKINEIRLLEDSVYRLKMLYNKDFDEILVKKENEIARIKEKNKRIQKILLDLGIRDPIFQPELGPIEKPEMLLVTSDAERPRSGKGLLKKLKTKVKPVKVEKFLTPEQQKKMDEAKRAAEERRLREMGDNWRERGLDQMMGGVLEIKREDELKKDIPIPLFIQEKKEEDYTEEEKRAAAEYHRKVRDLEEEREKYRKQLELELRKLQTTVQEGAQSFDELHQQLFMKKVKTELVVSQLELKIQRLRYSLLQEDEITHFELDLVDRLEKKRQLIQSLSVELSQAKKELDEYRMEYDQIVADDRAIEKGFRREFADVSVQLADNLYKHFRKRPRGQKAKVMESQAYDSHSLNPFSERPSTARQREESQRALDLAMQELDRAMPESVDPTVWERLCKYRREKVECEMLVKQRALTLAEMTAFVQRRHEEDEQLKNDIEELEEEINRLRVEKHRFFTNLEVQLLLKQGQVEVDPGNFIPDYTSSLLIHRSVVEELNKEIRQLSDSKIASMVESKDFRKGIIQLEWEHRKMTMEMEDLQNKMRDIISMKVTREIQEYLTNPVEYDAKKAEEAAALEKTILVQREHHEKLVKEKKRIQKQLQKSIGQLIEKNSSLLRDLEGLNVSVNERRHIHEISGDKTSDQDRMYAYKEIVKRRRLVDLAKAQSQEVAVLRAEVERLRMRTFAALVQVDH